MKRKVIKGVIAVFMKIFFRIKVIGKENIPAEGGCIICPNHKSYWDPPLVVAFNKRHINMIAKKELYKNPIIAWVGKIFNVFPVDRNGKDIEAVKHSLKVLKNGEILGIFPEGTRHGIEKGIKVKSGAVQMAIKAGVPIIPAGINGDYKTFKKTKITYGEPIYYNNIDAKDKDVAEKLTEELMNKIIELSK